VPEPYHSVKALKSPGSPVPRLRSTAVQPSGRAGSTGSAGGAYGYPKTEPTYMNLSKTLVMARRAGRLAGYGIGRMSPTPRVGTISR
jgi:hypothetical protein